MNKEQLTTYLKSIWPTVYRIINNTFYFLLLFIKNLIKMAINQIKGSDV
ncbi:MAG: hypothetical protein HZC02_03785 [Candidatus Levybacteria bacterium]|nr:hypothetical protein [Candidatus Levybacteria bacterium]